MAVYSLSELCGSLGVVMSAQLIHSSGVPWFQYVSISDHLTKSYQDLAAWKAFWAARKRGPALMEKQASTAAFLSSTSAFHEHLFSLDA